jgi:hypothetical protein
MFILVFDGCAPYLILPYRTLLNAQPLMLRNP